MTAPLKVGIKVLTDKNPSNDIGACNTLTSFLARVHSLEAINQLTSSQAEQLSQQAIAIKNSLGCDEVGPANQSEQSRPDESLNKGIAVLDIFR